MLEDKNSIFFERATPLEVDSKRKNFFKRGKVFVKQSGENDWGALTGIA